MVNKDLDKFFSAMERMHLSLTFDDVLLEPRMSSVVPTDVNLETRITRNVPLNIPLVSADMDRVTESKLAIVLAEQGGMGFIHRNMDPDDQAGEVDRVKYRLNAYIRNPICLRPNDTLGDLYEEMDEYDSRFSSFLVTDDKGRLMGLVTKDQTKFYDRKKHKSKPLSEIMIKNPFTITRKVSLQKAYEIMREEGVSKLIVTSKDGKVNGLYCWNDVKDIVEGENPMYNRDENGQLRVGASVGVHDYARAEKLLRKNVDVILVGTAHGHSKNVGETVRELKKSFGKSYAFDVLAGNVATAEGASYLAKCGADGVKVGLGPGSICTTRIVAGVGVPQITAVRRSFKGIMETVPYLPLCADGGLRNSGDMAKALAVGADNLMCGSLFAATEESPGKVVMYQGMPHKDYRGMGSLEAMREHAESQERYKQEGPEKLVPEGVPGLVPLRGSVRDVVFQFVGGIRSSFGYVGARSLKEFHDGAMLQWQTAAGKAESHPHDIIITTLPPNYSPEKPAKGGDD